MSRLLAALCLPFFAMGASLPQDQEQQPYVIKVHTDEVALTFHAEDTSGRTIGDLTADNLRVLDNKRPPARITLFTHHQDLPLRVAIVFDTTPSMANQVPGNKVVSEVVKTTLHDTRDRAMVMSFDFETILRQDWTSDPKLLAKAAMHSYAGGRSRFGGTAIWDSLYRICRDNIPAQTPGEETFASAIILFTDGEDNRSHALPEDVIEECQHRQTAIYPFVDIKRSHYRSAAGKALNNLAELTGGRMLVTGDLTASMQTLDTDLRDRYTLVYRPAEFKRDDRFHTIKLETPNRSTVLDVRKGYYASR